MRHVSELLVPWSGRPLLVCRGKMPRARGMAAHVRDGYGAFCQPKFECDCCEMLLWGFEVWDRTFMCSVFTQPWPRRPRILDWLLTLMATVQAEIVRVTFMFVGDLNGHHQEWLDSTTTNRHGVAAFDFVTVSGYDQLVNSYTWWNTWPLDDWCFWPSTGCCCSTNR